MPDTKISYGKKYANRKKSERLKIAEDLIRLATLNGEAFYDFRGGGVLTLERPWCLDRDTHTKHDYLATVRTTTPLIEMVPTIAKGICDGYEDGSYGVDYLGVRLVYHGYRNPPEASEKMCFDTREDDNLCYSLNLVSF